MAGANPAYMAGQLGHGTEVVFKNYASWIHGKQDDSEIAEIAEIAEIEVKPGGNIPELSQNKTATRKWLF